MVKGKAFGVLSGKKRLVVSMGAIKILTTLRLGLVQNLVQVKLCFHLSGNASFRDCMLYIYIKAS